MTVTVLNYWGVRNCEDVGQMVFNLVNRRCFRQDRRGAPWKASAMATDFQDAFVKPFRPDSNLSESDPSTVG